MIKINDERETYRCHLASECEPGTTLVDPDGHIKICVRLDDTMENVWVFLDARSGEAFINNIDDPAEAHGKLCSIEIKVLER